MVDHEDSAGRDADMAAPTDESSPVERQRPPRSGRRRLLILGVAIIVGVFSLGWVLDYVTASPSLCSSCHEMEARTEAWEQSAHVSVVCVDCHQQPHAWYAVPLTLADRTALLVRDVTSHLSGDYKDPIDSSASKVSPITDEVCLQCHDPNRTATSGYRILIDHVEHAKRNGSCVSCHVRTAHPLESRGRALSLMAQCYTCHGTAEQPEASDDCLVCHPEDYELVPAAHTEERWMNDHGGIALSDTGFCSMCHDDSLCDSCHGVEMPHPEGWAKGATGHARVANVNRAVCTQCHGDSLDMCTMCHHTGYEPARGTWIKQHYTDVHEEGAAQCMESCHSPVFCVGCHVGEELREE